LTHGSYPSDGDDTHNGGFENYDLSAFDEEYGFDDSYGDSYDYGADAFDTAEAITEVAADGSERFRPGEENERYFFTTTTTTSTTTTTTTTTKIHTGTDCWKCDSMTFDAVFLNWTNFLYSPLFLESSFRKGGRS